jgi:hypothetical protein
MNMKWKELKSLRAMAVITLFLLTLQYELGMVVSLSPNLPELSPFGFSLIKISDVLHLAGPVALAHAVLGSLVTFLSVFTLILSLRSKIRSLQILGSLGFLTMLGALTGGILFTISGFQEDHYSLAMASNFILAFIFYFLELYFLKPDSKTSNN